MHQDFFQLEVSNACSNTSAPGFVFCPLGPSNGLTEEQKRGRVERCSYVCKKIDERRSRRVRDIATSDERCVYQFTFETKQQYSSVGFPTGETRPDIFKRFHSAEKRTEVSLENADNDTCTATIPIQDSSDLGLKTMTKHHVFLDRRSCSTFRVYRQFCS